MPHHRRLILLVCCVSTASLADNHDTGKDALDEIRVTAQKRSQSIQDTAAAITAIDRQALVERGLTTLADAQNLIPSVRLQKESASTEIYIRGIGSTLDLPMIEPPNAYNINGVYVPREVTSASLVDIERIEVLPGPQGTLYGRGAIGGVVNTILRRPSDTLQTEATLEAGNYGHARATLTQNIPFGDAVRFRSSLSYYERDGYLESGADSADDLAGLLSLDIAPAENINVYLWGHIEKREGFAANLLSKGNVDNRRSQRFPDGDPWDDRLEGELEPFATLGPIDAQDRDWDTVLVGAEVGWRINDELSLTYLPSYLDFDWRQGYWLTHKNGDFGASIDQQTHELRLSHDAGTALTWLAGIYDYRIDTSGQLFIQFGPNELFPDSPPGLWLGASDVRDHELRGSALFGELTYAITEHTRFIAGGRVSRDKRAASGFQPDIVVEPAVDSDPVALFTGEAPPTWSNRESWSNVDWKLGIEFDADTDSMLYGNVQTGFQPGTFDVFPETTTRESELLAVTIGSRNLLLDGQLLLNGEAFYYLFDNLLTQAFDAATGTNRLTSADVDIYGLQLDLRAAPSDWPETTINFSVGYLHARYEDFIIDELDVYNGNQLQNAPDWTVNLGVSHAWPLASGADLQASLQARYESGFWGDFSHSSGIYQAAYTKTDATLTWHSPNRVWSVGAWVKNLENQDVQAAAATGNPVTDPGPGAPFLEAPRTYGIRVTYSSN